MLYLHMYVDVILFVMCKENPAIVMFTSKSHRLCLVPVLPVVCWRAHVLFTLIMCMGVHSGVQHTLRCVFALLFSRRMYPKLSASLDCCFWIALWYFLTFSYRRLTFFPKLYLDPHVFSQA